MNPRDMAADWTKLLQSINQAFALREQEVCAQRDNAEAEAGRLRQELQQADAREQELVEQIRKVEARLELSNNLERALHERELTIAEMRSNLEHALNSTLAMAESQREDRRGQEQAERARDDAVRRCGELTLQIEELSRQLDGLREQIGALHTRAEQDQQRWQRQSDDLRSNFRVQIAEQIVGAERLEKELALTRDRHQRQTEIYVHEIEELHTRLEGLSSKLSEASRQSTRNRLHHRFASATTQPLLSTVLKLQGRVDSAMELIMDTPMFTRTNYQPVFTPSANGVYRFEDFLVLHDRSFVRAAYFAILQREADPEGEAYYLEQVRSGVSKAKVLRQIMRSEEGRTHKTVIQGLSSQYFLVRVCEVPLVGPVVSAALFLAAVNSHMRDLRVLENHVIRIAEEAQALHEANVKGLRSMIEARVTR